MLQFGAIDDVFTQATLGNVAGVEQWLDVDPSLANVCDPAQDFFRVTPIYHAVVAGQREVTELLLRRGADVGPLSTILVRAAAERLDLAMAKMLLKHKADATRIGVGRWVLDQDLACLLTKHGADVTYESDPWGSWLWQSCTGNHGQKDDPEFVRALIEHGVDVNAIHAYWGRAALHFAAKAGFAQSIDVLLQAGADPNRADAKNGETPLFHAFKAGKSVDPRPIIIRLLQAGADPNTCNAKGQTVMEAHPKSRELLRRLK